MDLAGHPEFEAGNVHTDFIPQHYDQLFPDRGLSDKTICQAAISLMLIEQEKTHQHACSTLGTDKKKTLYTLRRHNALIKIVVKRK